MNGAACDSFQFVWNCIFLFVQISCNACCTYDVPTVKIIGACRLRFYIHLLVILFIAAVCSDIADVYLLGLHFRFAQMRPVTLAVYVNNVIFFGVASDRRLSLANIRKIC